MKRLEVKLQMGLEPGVSKWRRLWARLCLTVVPATLLIGGCASPTLNKVECQIADWHAIGYADGAVGHGAERIARHRKACSKHDAPMDLSAYNRGRTEGLSEYCTVFKGLELGRNNRNCGICSDYATVVRACSHGRKIHAVNQAIEVVTAAIRSADRAIAKARAWTPEKELSRRLQEVDELVQREEKSIEQNISMKKNKIHELRTSDDGADHQVRIDELNQEIGALREERDGLLVNREKRFADLRVKHERNREDLINENERTLIESMETMDESQQRRTALESELSTLHEMAETDMFGASAAAGEVRTTPDD